MSDIYRVRPQVLPILEAKLTELNLKAQKLGCEPVKLVHAGEETKVQKHPLTGVEHRETFLLLSVEGSTPKLAGWRLVAVVERLASSENLVRTVPGESCPAELRSTDTRCEHCNVRRARKEVFILAHDNGRHVQVGRSCLADFLGGRSPESVLQWASWIESLADLFAKATADECYWGNGKPAWAVVTFLEYTAICIRRLGWVSRKIANSDQCQSTGDVVLSILNPPRFESERAALEEVIKRNRLFVDTVDQELAAAALEWGKTLPTDQGDYLYNLGVACRLGFVEMSTVGIMASLIPAYMRHLEREAELRKPKKVSNHVGEIKKRLVFAVEVASIKWFESFYGSRALVKMLDKDGNVLVWWTNTEPDFAVGDQIAIKGTVKEHGEFNNIKQTVLSRVVEQRCLSK